MTTPAPLIRHPDVNPPHERRFRHLVSAAFGSMSFHVLLFLCLVLLLPGPASVGGMPQEDATPAEANVQPEPPPEPAHTEPLNIRDLDPSALAPRQETSLNLNRIDDVTVPAVVNPLEPIGVVGGTAQPPMTPPLPRGLDFGPGGTKPEGLMGTINPLLEAGGMSLHGMTLQDAMKGRSGAARKQALQANGGTGASEVAVAEGLHWLIRVQERDGRWLLDGPFPDRGQSNDIAGTALGLLPLLAAGKTHRASADNDWDKPIERALLFLMRKQDKRTGNFGGGMYAHCLATITLCEAYGLTQDPVLRRSAQMGVHYLVQAQHDGGGWRYAPGQVGDTSVTGWAVMAVKSGRMAGLDVPDSTFRRAVRYLDTCVAPDEGYGYQGPDPTPTMSAVGLLCRQYLQGWGPQHPRLIKGIDKNLAPVPPGAIKDLYYYYYATQVMHHFGGDAWKAWNDRMREHLVSTQDRSTNPAVKGSWSPAGDPHRAAGGRLLQTSLSLLTLEVYYRYLPLYYRQAGEKQQKLLGG